MNGRALPALLVLSVVFVSQQAVSQEVASYQVTSPDGRVEIATWAGDPLTYRIALDGRVLVERSPISLRMEDGTITVADEEFSVWFAGNPELWFPTEESYLTHFERLYEQLPSSGVAAGQMASMPVLVGWEDGPKIAITESDLHEYPGLYLEGTGEAALRGVLPAYPAEIEQVNDRTVRVVSREGFLARTSGPRTFPWRVFVVADEDADRNPQDYARVESSVEPTDTLVAELAPGGGWVALLEPRKAVTQ